MLKEISAEFEGYIFREAGGKKSLSHDFLRVVECAELRLTGLITACYVQSSAPHHLTLLLISFASFVGAEIVCVR